MCPMVLDLRELIGGVSDAVPFAYDVEYGATAKEFSDDLLTGLLRVEGRVENHAGYLCLTGTVLLEGTFRCARCCREFPRKLEFPLAYTLVESLANQDAQEEDGFLLLEEGRLDLSEVVRSQLLVEMPYRFLCRNDCKGLCPKCGCDLNVERCSCATSETDSRWAVLNGFFDDENEKHDL